jgi:hypothetical protein
MIGDENASKPNLRLVKPTTKNEQLRHCLGQTASFAAANT